MSDQHLDAPQRRIPRGVLPIAGILAVVALLVFVFNDRFGQDPRMVDSPLIGQPVASLSLPYLETEGELDLDALRGDIVVVNYPFMFSQE